MTILKLTKNYKNLLQKFGTGLLQNVANRKHNAKNGGEFFG